MTPASDLASGCSCPQTEHAFSPDRRALTRSRQRPIPFHEDMKRWKGGVVLGSLAVAVGAALVTHPWSEARIPTASEYSSALDVARDLNQHGLGCAHPTRPWKGTPPSILREVRGSLGDMLACSVDGQRVVLTVIPPALLNRWIRDLRWKPRNTSLQDAAADEDDGVMRARESMVCSWDRIGLWGRGTLRFQTLSASRVVIGGTLVVAASPTSTAASPTSDGPSA
jgi:hypothetical protein